MIKNKKNPLSKSAKKRKETMRFFFYVSLFLSFSSLLMGEGFTTYVTVGEYCDFLNAAAVVDLHKLYHETMSDIIRTGESGDYHYEVVSERESSPITFVTWLDAARYCNWKEHASPAREEMTPEITETGSYTLNDAMSGSVLKNENSHYFLPTREDSIPTSLLADSSLSYWGSSASPAGLNNGVPLFHHNKKGENDNKVCDPTLTASDLGFYVVQAEVGDCFNAASFLKTSNSGEGDGKWSAFDEVIGVIGALALIGGGGGYAYYRYRTNGNEEHLPKVNETTAANRRAIELEESTRDREEEDVRAEQNPAETMGDVITGELTNTENFSQDQRSLFKKWADWLRGHNHRNSIFQDADQIDYIPNEDLTSPDDRSRCQKIIWWMTQRFYTYKDVEDFKKRNPEYLQKQIERHKATIAEHDQIVEGHLTTIRGHEQTQQEKKQEEDQTRVVRLAQFKKDQGKLEEITKEILNISKLEPLCYSAHISPPVQYAGVSSPVPIQEPSYTLFQMLPEVTQYVLTTKLQCIEKEGRGSNHANEEEIANGQIQTQYHELCKADAEVMEGLRILMSKKELLWRCLAERKDDFVDVMQVLGRVNSIKSKISGIQQEIQSYGDIAQQHFVAAKRIFEGDEQSNLTRESNNRHSVASGISRAGSAEKPKKTKNALLKMFGSSSSDQGNDQQKTAEKELSAEIACRELGERIENQFSKKVAPITEKVEKYFVQSFEMLHLAEKNALLGLHLMRLYEADQGRKLWETSSLRPYLIDALTRARAKVNSTMTLLLDVKTILIGSWNKYKDESTQRELYAYRGGGWQSFAEEAAITQSLQTLETRTKDIHQGELDTLTQKIENAKQIAELLQSAGTNADQLLVATASTLETSRAAFLEAMREVLESSILQPIQSIEGPNPGSEGKKN